MYPDFRNKNWYEGLHKGADAVIKILAGEEPEKLLAQIMMPSLY